MMLQAQQIKVQLIMVFHLQLNENLSISAGRQVVDIDTAADDETNTGVSASYTMGSITIGGGMNEVNSMVDLLDQMLK